VEGVASAGYWAGPVRAGGLAKLPAALFALLFELRATRAQLVKALMLPRSSMIDGAMGAVILA
jgi:hypothetical protein